MSRYLVDRIAALPNVEVLVETQICGLEGRDGALEAIRWRRAGEEARERVRHLFLFIGAEPNTAWLAESDVALDEKGFVRTGADTGRERLPLETSRAGVFAIGDVRCGSVKRVSAAVGEGAQVVAALHSFLARGGRGLGTVASA
jgi:thioredoxin reductase (NADPH)